MIQAHEKHGTFVYESALGLLQRRIEDGYWYYDEDEKAAEAATASEDAAWRFLDSRSDYEYEYVEQINVRR